MKNKKILLLVIVLVIIVIGVFFLLKKSDQNLNPLGQSLLGCQVTKTPKIVSGESMTPLLQNSQEVTLMEDYYNKCGQVVKRGDIVAFNYRKGQEPLIKIVKVLDSDELEISENKLKVNGEFLKNSVGDVYEFSEKQIRALGMYIYENKHLRPGSFFIFGDNVKSSLDSRDFGAVSAASFLGKFEK